MTAPAGRPERGGSERGRPPCCPPEVTRRVIDLRGQGLSLAAISALLNAENVPTPAGGSTWAKSSVDRLLHTRHARQSGNANY